MHIQGQQFLQYCIGSAATLGLPESILGKLSNALNAKGLIPPKVIWLNGSDSTGCTQSLATIFHQTSPTDTADQLFNIIDLTFSPNFIVDAAELAEKQLMTTVKGRYILAIDGGIPTAFNGHTCMLWTDQGEELTAMEAVQMLAPGAAAVLAIGTCACYGNMPFDDPNPTGVVSVSELTGVPTVNIPGCATHPDWMVWTIAQLLSGETLQLDAHNRPTELYGNSIYQICPHKKQKEATEYTIPDQPRDVFQITKVAWDTEKAQLKVQGKGVANQIVSIYNADTGALLSAVLVNELGSWSLHQSSPSSIPHRLLAKSSNESLFSEVAKSSVISN